jgi:hypothetical protein
MPMTEKTAGAALAIIRLNEFVNGFKIKKDLTLWKHKKKK